MPIRFSPDVDRKSAQLDRQLAKLSGLGHWPPAHAGEWAVVLTRAGFSEERFEQFLAGELPDSYTSTPGDEMPVFTPRLIAGFEKWHRENAAPRGRTPFTIAERIELEVFKDPEGKRDWSDTRWAEYLGCSRSGVNETAIYQSLRAAHNSPPPIEETPSMAFPESAPRLRDGRRSGQWSAHIGERGADDD